MSVTEYEDLFRELSRYAALEVHSEEALARKFMNGLLTKISKVVATILTYRRLQRLRKVWNIRMRGVRESPRGQR